MTNINIANSQSLYLEKSLSIKPLTLITNPSTLSQDPTLIPLNQMQSYQMITKQDLNPFVNNIQNSKNPAPVINEKLQRCIDFKLGKYGGIYVGFKENSPKEELVLEHVIQYKRQFQLIYESEDRELFLFPKNECDVYKVFYYI